MNCHFTPRRRDPARVVVVTGRWHRHGSLIGRHEGERLEMPKDDVLEGAIEMALEKFRRTTNNKLSLGRS